MFSFVQGKNDVLHLGGLHFFLQIMIQKRDGVSTTVSMLVRTVQKAAASQRGQNKTGGRLRGSDTASPPHRETANRGQKKSLRKLGILIHRDSTHFSLLTLATFNGCFRLMFLKKILKRDNLFL